MFDEMWRADKEGYDTLHNQHMWFGSVGVQGKHGGGTLLHERWSKYVRFWQAINPSICVLDLDLKDQRMTLVVVYIHTILDTMTHA